MVQNMPCLDLDFIQAALGEDFQLAEQLSYDKSLREAMVDLCSKKKSLDYSDPMKLSLKMTLERGLTHRLRFEARDAIRVCKLINMNEPET
jgi:hypothetical protein